MYPPLLAKFCEMLRLPCVLLCSLLSLLVPEAHSAGSTVTNLLSNGGFEDGTHTVDNLWDGVDSDGYLAVFRFSAQVVTDRGTIGALAMPPSVALVDLNGDGKPDLLTADPTGYFRFYPNHGTATAPRLRTRSCYRFFCPPPSSRAPTSGPAAARTVIDIVLVLPWPTGVIPDCWTC